MGLVRNIVTFEDALAYAKELDALSAKAKAGKKNQSYYDGGYRVLKNGVPCRVAILVSRANEKWAIVDGPKQNPNSILRAMY